MLRLDDKGDPAHVEACRAAMMTYAAKIQGHIPQLAEDIRQRWGTPAGTKPKAGWPKRGKTPTAKELPGKAVVDEPRPEV